MSDILYIHRFLMKETLYKTMFWIIKQTFIVFLTSIGNVCIHAKSISLSNQKRQIQPILINLHPNIYSQELHYYLFPVKLDNYVGICNTLNDLSNKVTFPSKTEDLNIYVFKKVTGKKWIKVLTKYMSCECKCKFDEKNVT